MRKLKKAVSILLSIVLIGSMFTILSVTSASAAAVEVFARKWVRAENVVGDYYSFTDLYQNFIICRCWPEMDEPSFDYVYNQTENMSLNSHNEIRLTGWDDGNGKLVAKSGSDLIQTVKITNTYSSGGVKTGDSSQIVLYSITTLTALLLLVIMMIIRRRQSRAR